MADSQSSQYPNLNPNALVNSAQNAMSSIANSQTVQQIQNGPVAEKTRAEVNATRSEFSNLASSRTTPDSQTATGQNLTHYHSFFYNLLSWQNPRATAISYGATVITIIVARYAPLVSYALRGLWITLGIIAATEVAGHAVLGGSAVAKVRPARYYTIPRERLEAALEDVEQLINFFVIEFQRVLFAENVYATVLAFFTTLITYFLIKVTPAWGLVLLGTTALYFLPLVYIQNRELIDSQLRNASKMASDQSTQLRNLAQHHTNQAIAASQNAVKTASAKAQETIVTAKQTAADKGLISHETAGVAPSSAEKLTPKGSSTVDQTSETLSSTANKVSEQASATADKVSEQASVATNKASEATNSSNTAPNFGARTDGASDPITTWAPPQGIQKSGTEEILGVKKEDFPVVPGDEPFSETSAVKHDQGPISAA